jgi:uncharacterized membrane protein YgaE (UPF0421/DUF939 family)
MGSKTVATETSTAPESERFAAPFYLAISTGLALFIARKLHIDIGGLWVVLSAIVTTRKTLPIALTTARDQLAGTVIGALSGAAFGFLQEPAIGLAAAVVLAAAVCNSIPILRGSIYIACAAAAIVIVLPAGKPSYVTAWDRVEDYLIGAGVALAIVSIASLASRWWPQKA